MNGAQQWVSYLVLKDSAHRLTGEDLLRITEIAEQAHAAVHISNGPWQMLLGVPPTFHQSVAEALQAMDPECDIQPGAIDLP
jgi:hypothetical protein